MKVDSNLRAAIRAAHRSQPSYDWNDRSKARQKAIEDLLISKPSVALKVGKLAATLRRAEKAKDSAAKELCEKFGLRVSGENLEFANCDQGGEAFLKAGGKIPVESKRWDFEATLAQIAGASEAEGKKILKKIGINWE